METACQRVGNRIDDAAAACCITRHCRGEDQIGKSQTIGESQRALAEQTDHLQRNASSEASFDKTAGNHKSHDDKPDK